jgi:gamma-glutamyltranspeptidase/glutathione hydrolase
MAVAPHSLAAESAVAVLREGGNAIEAMIAAAATIAVVYPHMNSIGGDSFWVIHQPGKAMGGIDACGAAAGLASRPWYAQQGITQSIPFRGPVAANTVAGTLSGWGAAHKLSMQSLGGRMPLQRLLDDAITYARDGVPVTHSQHQLTAAKLPELIQQPGFASTFLSQGQSPATGSVFAQPKLAATLEHIARAGTDDFYRGDLARTMARELEQLGSPLRLADLQRHQAQLVNPLTLQHSLGRVHNMTPPTQGLMSLIILGLLDRCGMHQYQVDSADHVHCCVEATKLAFQVRDQHLTDPAYMKRDPVGFLSPKVLDQMAQKIQLNQAMPWGAGRPPADTIWMGVVDGNGLCVSFIQSIYHEFGSGVVLPTSGVNWQNRGCSFSLSPHALNTLEPLRKPFHTLNPALAVFDSGRTMVYGTMGGDGQPQTQAAVFSRVVHYGLDPQEAISRPRWLLGRTWGQTSDTLKLEGRFSSAVTDELRRRGHDVEIIGDLDETVGHAGCILREPNGVLRGGFDPRSDGAVVAY